MCVCVCVCVCVAFSLSVHLLMDTWVVSMSWLLWIMLQWTWEYKFLFEILISILLAIYPEVGLLGHIVVLILILWGMFILFSIAAITFYTPTNSVQGFQFLHNLANTWYILLFVSLILAILITVRWYLMVVSVCITLINVEHLFM